MKNLIKYIVNTMILLLLSSQISVADTDYNLAKTLLDAGEIQPLETIISKVSKHTPGSILEVELEIDDGQPLYEIELIDNKGQVWKLKVNARTAVVIERKLDD